MRKWLAGLLFIVSVVLLTISIYFLMGMFLQERQDNQLQHQLQEVLQEKSDETGEDSSGDSLTQIDAGILALHEENPDCIGWITIEGTRIDYPVMYRPGDKNYYLHRDFNGEYSANGCLYLVEECVPGDSDNLIIYGHHMNSGKMFADLEKYKDEDFYKEHPMIQFRTIWGNEEYEILAAFTTPVYTGNDFNYYSFIKAQKGEDYEYFIREIKRKGIYETKVTAFYGEKLLTLSTCEYSQKNGRMVVVAKKVERTGG
ncbi:SrtB family sortase [Clostridium sp. AM43-3BH]|uniref:class B sortase n=1 Tax=Clostridium sp. AM43-3BH TaxID=2293032 RepID=UPI000E4F8A0D|nr:class B sortase [Clostridium sp. AM43-3BH]RHS73915.1 SrtB family sortase [Clostridium sp. AM43-3BH]